MTIINRKRKGENCEQASKSQHISEQLSALSLAVIEYYIMWRLITPLQCNAEAALAQQDVYTTVWE